MRGKDDLGVIVGADSHLEWLLPWWWLNFRAYNDLPVVFFDFGLSQQAKNWCEKRGECTPLLLPSNFAYQAIPPATASTWEETHGIGVWHSREHCFKKPFACLQSPFAKTLWLDLDCEVRCELLPLFQTATPFAVAEASSPCQAFLKAEGLLLPGKKSYDSGVLFCEKGSSLLERWSEECTRHNHLHIDDQAALSFILDGSSSPFQTLSRQWNWSHEEGSHDQAHIFHWTAREGKTKLKEQIKVLRSIGLLT